MQRWRKLWNVGSSTGPRRSFRSIICVCVCACVLVCVCVCICTYVLCELSVHGYVQRGSPQLFLRRTQTCLEQDLTMKSTCFKEQRLSILPTQFIYMFYANLTINNYYFPKPHRPGFICNGDRHFFFLGNRDSIFK